MAIAVAQLSPEALAALKLDYEGCLIPIATLSRTYGLSRSQLYLIVNAQGWRLRSPKRVDKNDLIQKLLRLLERQVLTLETTMTKSDVDESAVLGKLATTLDRLISLDNANAKPRARKQTGSKVMTEIRHKVAERLAELNGD